MEDNIEQSWRTSSYTGNGGGNCVEVAGANRGVLVRDTKDRGSGTLTFTPEAWCVFTDALK